MEGLKYDFRETRLLTGSQPTISPNLGVYFSFLILIIAENASFLAKTWFEIKKSKKFFFKKNNLNYGVGETILISFHT